MNETIYFQGFSMTPISFSWISNLFEENSFNPQRFLRTPKISQYITKQKKFAQSQAKTQRFIQKQIKKKYHPKMDIIIDYTSNQQFSMDSLQSIQEINQITFIVPIFLFFQNNFKLLLNYVQYLSQRPLIKTHIQPIGSQDQVKQLEQHSVVLVRGTFDHMHLGHQVLLLKAVFIASHKLIIEVKDDSIMNNKRLKQLIQPIDIRKDNIKKFLSKFVDDLKPQLDIKVQTITQPYGSAPYTKGIDALVITQQSLHSFKHINILRKSNNGLKKVQMILSPILTSTTQTGPKTKQQRVNSKISSHRIRQFILQANNFTLQQYLDYRKIWDSLIKQIYSLCRIKDVDFIVVQRWWQRIVYKHSKRAGKSRRNNKEIYLAISEHNNMSTPNQHSLNQVAMNLALLFDGVQEQQKSIQGVIRSFLQNLLKKKGKSKTCKKIRKMILNDVKQFVHKSNPKKQVTTKAVQQDIVLVSNPTSNINTIANVSSITQPKLNSTVSTPTVPVSNDTITNEANMTIQNEQQNKTIPDAPVQMSENLSQQL